MLAIILCDAVEPNGNCCCTCAWGFGWRPEIRGPTANLRQQRAPAGLLYSRQYGKVPPTQERLSCALPSPPLRCRLYNRHCTYCTGNAIASHFKLAENIGESTFDFFIRRLLHASCTALKIVSYRAAGYKEVGDSGTGWAAVGDFIVKHDGNCSRKCSKVWQATPPRSAVSTTALATQTTLVQARPVALRVINGNLAASLNPFAHQDDALCT